MAEIDSSDNAPATITGRSILVGAALSLVIAIGIPYGSMVIQGSRLGLSSATPAAFFLLFVLLLTLSKSPWDAGVFGAVSWSSSSP